VVRRRPQLALRASACATRHRPRLDLASARRQPNRLGRAAAAHQPGASMRPASLLLVFVLAKAAGLFGHHLPISAWSPIAYVWQDALVVLVFAAIDASLGERTRAAWSAYAALAF